MKFVVPVLIWLSSSFVNVHSGGFSGCEETAMARSPNGENCFTGMRQLNSNRWGWSLEISTTPQTFDVYAGAGQCNVNNGFKSGEVTLVYDAGARSCSASYKTVDGVGVKNMHLYCGSTVYPTNHRGRASTAFGQWNGAREGCSSNSGSPADAVTTATCKVSKGVTPDGQGKVYAAVHFESIGCAKSLTVTNPHPLPPGTPGLLYDHHSAHCWGIFHHLRNTSWSDQWETCDDHDRTQRYKYNSTTMQLESSDVPDLCVVADADQTVSSDTCAESPEFQWYLDDNKHLKNKRFPNLCIVESTNQTQHDVKFGYCSESDDTFTIVTTVPPTSSPTSSPTGSPSKPPSGAPTRAPTGAPTASPTDSPTANPSKSPTKSPTGTPTGSPTGSPSKPPSGSPTRAPTGAPTASPTDSPTTNPSKSPTKSPTGTPTGSPTGSPSKAPTRIPTTSPTGSKPSSKATTGTATGDPHIQMYGGNKIEFHGECDLLFLRNDGFEKGMGMEIQLRTKQERFWSFIQKAALKIGEDTLEFQGGKTGVRYWINGNLGEPLRTGNEFFLSGFKVHFREVVPEKQHFFRIDLHHGDGLVLSNFREYVSVNIHAKNERQFKDSKGLLGSFPDGIKYARDGVTVIEDSDQFGNEWQVLEKERSLFQSTEGTVQAPHKCIMPPTMEERKNLRRRLGESLLTQTDAENACLRVVNENFRDDCVFDVLATNDLELAENYY